jgi:3-keto-5-aminohexanoate cleavage enzyme
MRQKPKDVYQNIPPRHFPEVVGDPNVGADFNGRPKWNIPDKIQITCAIVGAPIMRARNPNQPYTTAEIRKSAMECIEAGATSIHLHVRNAQGNGFTVSNKDTIRMMHEIIDPIREKYGYKVVIDGSECTRPTFAEEMEIIDADFSEIAPLNPPMTDRRMIQAEAYYLQEKGIKPAIAIYSDGDLSKAVEWLIVPGIIQKPYYFGLLPAYGIGGSQIPNQLYLCEYMANIIRQIKDIDKDAIISVPSAGRASSYLATMGIMMGLDLRIGMEDTYFKWPHKDDIIESNVSCFKDFKTIAETLGRRIETADEYRKKLGMKPKNL